MNQLTRIAALPGSTSALGTSGFRLEPAPRELDRAGVVARALRQMEASLARQQVAARAHAVLDQVVTKLLDDAFEGDKVQQTIEGKRALQLALPGELPLVYDAKTWEDEQNEAHRRASLRCYAVGM